jgi:hypothetical protein
MSTWSTIESFDRFQADRATWEQLAQLPMPVGSDDPKSQVRKMKSPKWRKQRSSLPTCERLPGMEEIAAAQVSVPPQQQALSQLDQQIAKLQQLHALQQLQHLQQLQQIQQLKQINALRQQITSAPGLAANVPGSAPGASVNMPGIEPTASAVLLPPRKRKLASASADQDCPDGRAAMSVRAARLVAPGCAVRSTDLTAAVAAASVPTPVVARGPSLLPVHARSAGCTAAASADDADDADDTECESDCSQGVVAPPPSPPAAFDPQLPIFSTGGASQPGPLSATALDALIQLAAVCR